MRFDEMRRAVVQEWLDLPPEQRRSQSQALEFADKYARQFPVDRIGDPTNLIMRWLLPHIPEKNGG